MEPALHATCGMYNLGVQPGLWKIAEPVNFTLGIRPAMPEYKDIVSILATLVASFAGAWGAFLLENERRMREVEDRNIGAANRAIYTLFNLWNILEQYRKETLEPCRGKSDAWLNLAAQPTIPTGEHTFQANELQFLLQSSKAEVYSGLMLEEQRFAIAIDLIRARSAIVLDEVFPKMSAAKIPVGKALPEAEVEEVLGIGLTHKLKKITTAIFRNVDEDIVSLKEQYGQIQEAMKQLYPSRKVLEIIFEVPKQ